MNWILFGHKSCGKTYFGKRLAEAFSKTFIDTDVLIEQQFSESLSIRQIALKIGEKAFRSMEREAVCALQNSDAVLKKQAVIAVGGGTVLDAENCAKLASLGQLVYLIVEKLVLKQRMMQEGLPSFLDSLDSFEKMYQERTAIYEKIGAIKMHV
ncbi:MAG TPA: shikimate kinase [Rhabdochlamydiaceae bacterium]